MHEVRLNSILDSVVVKCSSGKEEATGSNPRQGKTWFSQ